MEEAGRQQVLSVSSRGGATWRLGSVDLQARQAWRVSGAGALLTPRAVQGTAGTISARCPLGGVRGGGRWRGALLHGSGRPAPPGRALPPPRWASVAWVLVVPAPCHPQAPGLTAMPRGSGAPRVEGTGQHPHSQPLAASCDFEAGLCGWNHVPRPGLGGYSWDWSSGASPSRYLQPAVDHTLGTEAGGSEAGRGPRATHASPQPGPPGTRGVGGRRSGRQLHRVRHPPSRFQATLPSLRPACWARGAERPGSSASLCRPPRPLACGSGITWASRSTSVSGPEPRGGGHGGRPTLPDHPDTLLPDQGELRVVLSSAQGQLAVWGAGGRRRHQWLEGQVDVASAAEFQVRWAR